MHDDHGAHADDERGRIGRSSWPVRARICSAADLNESPGLAKSRGLGIGISSVKAWPKWQEGGNIMHDDHAAHADDEWLRIGTSSWPLRTRICPAADLNESPRLAKSRGIGI